MVLFALRLFGEYLIEKLYINSASVLYRLLKLYARFALKLYCPYLYINKPDFLNLKGPLLLAANHPNSFLDGMIITTLFDQPVYSLARGDAFAPWWANYMLRRLQLLPVYRTSEGVENLEHNYTTFAECIEVFKKGGIVLIFSEGLCENEWHLRPLRKGTARLAITAWESDIDLRILPVGFNYSSFKAFGKAVHLLFGNTFNKHIIDGCDTHGKQLLAFNTELQQQLQPLVYEINEEDQKQIKATFRPTISILKIIFLLLPAVIGLFLHIPLFYVSKGITHFYFADSGHYDSVLTSLLIVLYPIYLIALTIVLFFFFGWLSLLLLIIAPFTAWAFMQLKVLFR